MIEINGVNYLTAHEVEKRCNIAWVDPDKVQSISTWLNSSGTLVCTFRKRKIKDPHNKKRNLWREQDLKGIYNHLKYVRTNSFILGELKEKDADENIMDFLKKANLPERLLYKNFPTPMKPMTPLGYQQAPGPQIPLTPYRPEEMESLKRQNEKLMNIIEKLVEKGK